MSVGKTDSKLMYTF